MKINKVTITGADDKTYKIELMRLFDKYPFVEWGILFSQNREGQDRYPSMKWINATSKFDLPLSAHFCGWWSKEILESQNFSLINKLSPKFKRIQLNYNFTHSKGWKIEPILDYLQSNEKRSIILQYNRSNKDVIDNLIKKIELPKNLHFLYDSSGGRGTQIESIGSMLGNQYTGYSGGIDVENVEDICSLIKSIPSDNYCWIDLETGARTNNHFDIEKVEKILEISSKFIN